MIFCIIILSILLCFFVFLTIALFVRYFSVLKSNCRFCIKCPHLTQSELDIYSSFISKLKESDSK